MKTTLECRMLKAWCNSFSFILSVFTQIVNFSSYTDSEVFVDIWILRFDTNIHNPSCYIWLSWCTSVRGFNISTNTHENWHSTNKNEFTVIEYNEVLTLRITLMKQKLLILPEYLSSLPVFVGFVFLYR